MRDSRHNFVFRAGRERDDSDPVVQYNCIQKRTIPIHTQKKKEEMK